MEGLRKFAKSRLGQFSMVLVVAPMAFLGMSGGSSSGSPDQVVTIGEQGISLNQLQTAINNQRAALIEQGVDSSLIKEDVLQKQILETLINQTLLRQQASKLGLSVSDATITAMLKQHPDLQDKEGKFSNDLFALAMSRNNMTKDQLFSEQRGQMALEQLTNGIVGTAIYPMSAIDDLIDLQLESRNVWLYRIAWQNFQEQVTVTDADIEDYYNQHRDLLKSIPMVDLSYIKLTANRLDVTAVTEEELQQQYEAYKQENDLTDMRKLSHILLTGDDAESKAIEVKNKLDNEADFVAMAAEYSADPSKENGGDIGRFDTAMFGEDGATVASVLKDLKVGDVSQPVKTIFGYHIFYIAEDNSDEIPTLESLKEVLSQKAKVYKQQILFTDLVTRINESVADGLSIQDIANQEKLSVEEIKNYQKTDNLSNLAYPSVIAAAFDEFTIQDQSVSPSIEVEDSMVWVQPANYRPTASMTLEESTPSIRALLKQQKATKLALDEAKNVASSIKVQADINNQAVPFMPLVDLKRQNQVLSKIENSTAFSLTAPDAEVVGDDIVDGIIAIEVETKTGASVIVVDKIKTTDDAQLTDLQKIQVAGDIRNNFGEDQLNDYLHYLNTVAKVEIDQDKIDKANGVVK